MDTLRRLPQSAHRLSVGSDVRQQPLLPDPSGVQYFFDRRQFCPAHTCASTKLDPSLGRRTPRKVFPSRDRGSSASTPLFASQLPTSASKALPRPGPTRWRVATQGRLNPKSCAVPVELPLRARTDGTGGQGQDRPQRVASPLATPEVRHPNPALLSKSSSFPPA